MYRETAEQSQRCASSALLQQRAIRTSRLKRMARGTSVGDSERARVRRGSGGGSMRCCAARHERAALAVAHCASTAAAAAPPHRDVVGGRDEHHGRHGEAAHLRGHGVTHAQGTDRASAARNVHARYLHNSKHRVRDRDSCTLCMCGARAAKAHCARSSHECAPSTRVCPRTSLSTGLRRGWAAPRTFQRPPSAATSRKPPRHRPRPRAATAAQGPRRVGRAAARPRL